MKKQVKAMNDADSIQVLQQRMDHLEMRMKEFGLKEAKATQNELKAIQEAHKEIAEGNFVTLDQIRARMKKK